jgi:uncharacterized protein DUF4328
MSCACPNCERKLKVPDHLRGANVRCPACGVTFAAPAADEAAFGASDRRDDALGDGARARHFSEQVAQSPHRRAVDFHEDWDESDRPLSKRPKKLPGQIRAVTAMVFLGVTILTEAIGLAQTVYHYSLLSQAVEMNPVPPNLLDDLDLSETVGGFVALFQFLCLVGTAIAFCVWMYKAHANLRVLNVRELRYKSGWAAGAWFVPFLNLVRPCQIAQEIWRASDPSAPRRDARWWQSAPASALIGFWWAAWILGNVLGQIGFRLSMSLREGDWRMARNLAGMDLADHVVSIGCAVMAIFVIRNIQSRQKQKLQNLNSDSSDDWDAAWDQT